MKRYIPALLMLTALSAFARPEVERIDPPCWWTGMECDTLQLMVTGRGIADCQLAVNREDVTVAAVKSLDSPNYLFVDLVVGENAVPGDIALTFSDKKGKATVKYPLLARSGASRRAQGFDASDVLYLIMPDRFADGNPKNNGVVDRADPNARHGGDIQGIIDHLDYLSRLGITAVWVNPVLENDMPDGSYHGYSTTDYYRIDSRLGSNDDWRRLVEECHRRGIKVVMDMIFNHCGSNHPWVKDLPSRDWLNFPDGSTQTNFRLSTVYDPYASDFDRARSVDGWFVPTMPDLNQRNPFLMRYLTQNSIWWIEYSGIDGIRMDTYPYADRRQMANWCNRVIREFPRFNIVGECWYANEGAEAFWQKNSRLADDDSALPTVMDFIISLQARDAFLKPIKQYDQFSGLNLLYNHLALDFLFPDPQHILTFLDNHDTDRFLPSMPENLDQWKQAQTFLLTSRGIPQIYYGTEILMNGGREGSDGYVRRDFPGGFPGDDIDAFTHDGLSDLQKEATDFLTRLLNWRRGNDAIARGSLKHFMPENGLYVYSRRFDRQHAHIIMNGTDEPLKVDMSRYSELLPVGASFTDIITGRRLTIEREMTFPPRATFILE
ncbi:MAG: glycoside hydrolase family 13 protein [Muribaculaceae bacterium]|nr:glycoside hydrolase family 13 protein [Muribaculaceae bacterium]